MAALASKPSADLAIHEGEGAMEIEGISADEGGGESRDGVVDVGRGHERIARGRIHVAPSLRRLRLW